jgi:hypothetical protein
MNLYLVSQDLNDDYDTFDAVVVAADNEQDARKIHPSELEWDSYSNDWVHISDIDKLNVELLGTAAEGVEAGVVLASYNTK